MKKILVVLLLSILLTGCSSSEDFIRVGMDLRFYPFTGVDESGNPSGVEVDIAYELGEYLGKKVEIVNTEFSMLIPALQSGEIDLVLGSMSINEEREKTVDFSKPYFYDKIVALVNKDFAYKNKISNDTLLNEFFLYKAKYIGITGSVSISIPESYGFEVKEVTTDAVAAREIVTGSSDVLIGAYTLYGINNTNKKTTVMYKNAIEVTPIGIAVKSGNVELLNRINAFLDQMESSGLTDDLRKKWDSEISKKLFDPDLKLDYYLKNK